mmetsp:Transcript_60301/g.147986  ORF Transcript_60301/g.147986 Transcript_60301/m.147986 type:complete len:92 (-) Transcript_60301:42-317(-)
MYSAFDMVMGAVVVVKNAAVDTVDVTDSIDVVNRENLEDNDDSDLDGATAVGLTKNISDCRTMREGLFCVRDETNKNERKVPGRSVSSSFD